MRDMVSAGTAVYDEFPEMHRLAARRFSREPLPPRRPAFIPAGISTWQACGIQFPERQVRL